MPSFKYTAKDINGKKVSGTVNSTDENELYSLLKTKGLYLLDSEEVRKKRNTSRLGSKDVAYFCRQLGTLLNSGISLVRSLTIMVNQEDASAICYGMGDGLDEVKKASAAQKNLVLSPAAL